jgi:hypothetical protein
MDEPIHCATFHPLPDRDRSRIASGLSVGRLPPLRVTSLLILRVTVSANQAERRGEATVAGPSALARKCPGGVASNLAVLGGNDPHSYGVTSRRASMNTLGPKFGGGHF